jgi:glycine/D-amino acid oxidase-like deaminating enzyme
VHVVVIGGGVIGLLTAVECAARGAVVSVLDQAAIPNTRGTSHDWHRIVRALHPHDAATTRRAVAAHRAWLALEEQLSTRLFVRTGALTALPPDELQDAGLILAAAGASADALGPDELTARYAHIRFPAGLSAILEADAGVVLADRALAALTAYLRAQPTVGLRPHTRAVTCDVDTGVVRCADGSVLRGDRIILAAGPWSRRLLSEELAAELTLVRQSVLFCRVPAALGAAWRSTPAITAFGDADGTWGVPPVAGTPMKLSAASTARPVDAVAGNRPPARLLDDLVKQLSRMAIGLCPSWVTGARDFYYLADATTGGSVLAPQGERAWAFAACGGTAFKFAPLVARSLAERALDSPLLAAA